MISSLCDALNALFDRTKTNECNKCVTSLFLVYQKGTDAVRGGVAE